MPYFTNNGKYQERAEYYRSLLPSDNGPSNNLYLDIYRCALEMYSAFHTTGLEIFDRPSNMEAGVSAIRETQGFGRAWGHARETLELVNNWRGFLNDIKHTSGEMMCAEADVQSITIEREATSQLLAQSMESLLDSLLEVLPAFVRWTPTARNSENQPVVDFLQRRGDHYRKVGSPKFYAYDRVIKNLIDTDITITTENCKYIKGVGPRIAVHIINFLNGIGTEFPAKVPTNNAHPPVVDPEWVLDTNESWHSPLILSGNNPYHNGDGNDDIIPDLVAGDEEDEEDDVIPELVDGDDDRGTMITITIPEPVPFMAKNCPVVVCENNEGIVEFLWQGSRELWSNGARGRAWSWRRAAESISKRDNPEWDDTAFIGPYIHTVVHRFVEKRLEFPTECPHGLYDEKQELVEMLWNSNHRLAAAEISCNPFLPQVARDFEKMLTFSPSILNTVFQGVGNAPPATNWLNQSLINWLWRSGNACPGPQAASYYNAAKTVSRKRTQVKNLRDVKFIGEYIAERAAGEVYGIVDPQRYGELRREVNNLRKRVCDGSVARQSNKRARY